MSTTVRRSSEVFMAKVISFKIFQQRKERQQAALEMERRQRSIRRLIGYAEKHCNWDDDNERDN